MLALGPIGWLLFYWLDLVEYQAIVKSVKRLLSGGVVQWQRWQREGVFVGSAEPAKPSN